MTKGFLLFPLMILLPTFILVGFNVGQIILIAKMINNFKKKSFLKHQFFMTKLSFSYIFVKESRMTLALSIA